MKKALIVIIIILLISLVYYVPKKNFEITDNDILGTATIFHTGGGKIGPRGCSSCSITSTERYGIIARNEIWNANAAHWFDNAHEVSRHQSTLEFNQHQREACALLAT